MKKVKAICLKEYPDEDDMISFVNGELEACEVRIFRKGKTYYVNLLGYDREYFKILKP